HQEPAARGGARRGRRDLRTSDRRPREEHPAQARARASPAPVRADGARRRLPVRRALNPRHGGGPRHRAHGGPLGGGPPPWWPEGEPWPSPRPWVASRRLRRRFFLASALLLAGVLGLLVVFVTYRLVTRPIGALVDAAERVTAGDFTTQVVPAGPRELRS